MNRTKKTNKKINKRKYRKKSLKKSLKRKNSKRSLKRKNSKRTIKKKTNKRIKKNNCKKQRGGYSTDQVAVTAQPSPVMNPEEEFLLYENYEIIGIQLVDQEKINGKTYYKIKVTAQTMSPQVQFEYQVSRSYSYLHAYNRELSKNFIDCSEKFPWKIQLSDRNSGIEEYLQCINGLEEYPEARAYALNLGPLFGPGYNIEQPDIQISEIKSAKISRNLALETAAEAERERERVAEERADAERARVAAEAEAERARVAAEAEAERARVAEERAEAERAKGKKGKKGSKKAKAEHLTINAPGGITYELKAVKDRNNCKDPQFPLRIYNNLEKPIKIFYGSNHKIFGIIQAGEVLKLCTTDRIWGFGRQEAKIPRSKITIPEYYFNLKLRIIIDIRKTAPGKTAPGKTAPGKTAPGKTAPGKTAPGESIKFVLIPGSNNLWGKNRIKSGSPAYWQSEIEELIGEENILKSGPEYTGLSAPLHCGERENKPNQVRQNKAVEMQNCVRNTFMNNIEVPKSVISTSQGSAIFIDYISKNPDMLNNVRSIVLVSPATIWGKDNPEEALHKLSIFLDECKNRRIGILLLLNQGTGTKSEGRTEGDNFAGWRPGSKNCNASSCSDIINSMNPRHGDVAIYIPSTTHSLDIKNSNHPYELHPLQSGVEYPVEERILYNIKQWCENPILSLDKIKSFDFIEVLS